MGGKDSGDGIITIEKKFNGRKYTLQTLFEQSLFFPSINHLSSQHNIRTEHVSCMYIITVNPAIATSRSLCHDLECVYGIVLIGMS